MLILKWFPPDIFSGWWFCDKVISLQVPSVSLIGPHPFYMYISDRNISGQPCTCTLNKPEFGAQTDRVSEDFLGHPNCSSSVRSWTDTDTPKGWGAPTPAASRPSRVLCGRASSDAGSGSSARIALSAPSPSVLRWKMDPAVRPRVPDLSAWVCKEWKQIIIKV